MIPETISGQWIGDLRGSRVGNLFVEFTRDGDVVTANVRIAALGGGPADILVGTLLESGGQIHAAVKDTNGEDVGRFAFTDIRDTHVEGEWETRDNNRGVFGINKTGRVPASTSQDPPQPNEPLQIVNRNQKLPKFAIFRDELRDLMLVMKELVQTPNDVAVRAPIDGVDINRLAEDFWRLPSLPREMEYIHISLQEPASFAPRSININLSPTDCSFNVSGRDEVWVNGTFSKLDRFLSRRRGFWRTAFEKYGLLMNLVAFLVAIVLGPSLDLPSRIVLITATVLGMWGFKLAHDRATKVRIFARDDYKAVPYIDLPRLWTTLLGAGLIGAVTVIYAWLSQNGLTALLSKLIGP